MNDLFVDGLLSKVFTEPTADSLIASRIAWESMIKARWFDQWLVNIPDRQGVTKTCFGLLVQMDRTIPEHTIEIRDRDGKLLGVIENVGS